MYDKLIFVGNIGAGPSMRYTPSGQAIATFSVAVNRGSGDKKFTVWFRVSAWDKLAETCNEYLHKGSKVLVEGHLTPDQSTGAPRIWTGKDGKTGTSYEVNASVVRFLSEKESAEKSGSITDELLDTTF